MNALANNNIDTTYPNNDKPYKAYLVEMMTFLDNEAYPPDQNFSVEGLCHICADDVANYLKWKAFGEANPSQMTRPMKARSSTLADAKKAISHFIPNHRPDWDDMNLTGNPTKSAVVNDVIAKVKKFEVRGEGVPSQA